MKISVLAVILSSTVFGSVSAQNAPIISRELTIQVDFQNDRLFGGVFKQDGATFTLYSSGALDVPRVANIKVVEFPQGPSSADAILELKKLGLRPVNYGECMGVYSAINQRIVTFTKSHFLVCLGSTTGAGEDQSVDVIDGSRGVVWRLIPTITDDWNHNGRFLAVPSGE